jgi:hypothetical protein
MDSLFDKLVATSIFTLYELCDDILEGLKEKGTKPYWTKDKYFDEYGFYLDSSDKSKNLFCGMWHTLWETKSSPFCFCLDWKEKLISYDIASSFKKIISSENNRMLEIIELDQYLAVSFKKEYFENLHDCKPILELFIRVVENLNFNLHFKR